MRKKDAKPAPILQAQPEFDKRCCAAFQGTIRRTHMKPGHRLLAAQITGHLSVRCLTDILPADLLGTDAVFIKTDFPPAKGTRPIEIYGDLIIWFQT